MKTTVKIPKSRLTAPVDFNDVMYARSVRGVKLAYNEFGFMQLDSGKSAFFDAFSAVNKYKPLIAECGVVAFPFYCGCMTDKGERVAYCGLRFCEERAAEWKLLMDERALSQLHIDADAAAVPVPSGVCCFADEASYREYFSHIKDEVHPLAGHILLNGQTHTVVELYGKKFAVFSSGWGDGVYRCYAGYTADGRLTAILADFGMIDYGTLDDSPVEVEIEVADGTYVYDPEKSEHENALLQWTLALSSATDPYERMRAYARRGYAHHSAGQKEAALADYNNAIDCCMQVGDRAKCRAAWSVFDNAAELYAERSDYESAIRVLRSALESGDGFNMGAFVKLIDMYLLSKNTDKAVETAAKMVKKRSDDPVVHMKYAECCVSAMDYKTAAAEFETLARDFELYENYFDEASCLIELGEYKKASDALGRHPFGDMYEQYWYYKAYIDYRQGMHMSALASAQKAYDIDPEFMPSLYLLIDIESVLQQYHAVARYAEEYKRLRPDHEYGYSVCAEAHLLLGNMSECARNYRYLYENIKNTDKYAALAAMLCSVSGDKSRSRAILKRLRRKRSPYYHGAELGIHISKYRSFPAAISSVAKRLEGDKEFLFQLAAFLFATKRPAPATLLLGAAAGKEERSFEVVAQQMRIADYLNDKKQFFAFFDYYTETFFAPGMPASEKRALAERLLHDPARRRGWISGIEKPPKAGG